MSESTTDSAPCIALSSLSEKPSKMDVGPKAINGRMDVMEISGRGRGMLRATVEKIMMKMMSMMAMKSMMIRPGKSCSKLPKPTWG